MVGTSRQGGEEQLLSLDPAVVLEMVLELVLGLVLNPGDGADPNLSASPAQLNPTVQAPLTDWNHLC